MESTRADATPSLASGAAVNWSATLVWPAGTVTFAGLKTGYGYTVTIRHKYGFTTLYAHNSHVLVYNGQKVRKGQKIALLGRSGRATGFHLHFEIRINNVPVDPWPFITTEI